MTSPQTHTRQGVAVISEEISRGDCGVAEKMVQQWKVSVLLRNILPEHLKKIWFPKIMADSQFLLAHCLTEPRGASDRWLPYDRIPRRFVRNLLREPPPPGGQARVFLNLCAGLDAIGAP